MRVCLHVWVCVHVLVGRSPTFAYRATPNYACACVCVHVVGCRSATHTGTEMSVAHQVTDGANYLLHYDFVASSLEAQLELLATKYSSSTEKPYQVLCYFTISTDMHLAQAHLD